MHPIIRHQCFQSAATYVRLPRILGRPPAALTRRLMSRLGPPPARLMSKLEVYGISKLEGHPIPPTHVWAVHFPGCTLHKQWYTDPQIRFPWCTRWDEWEGLCLFYDTVDGGKPKIDKLFKDAFDVHGVVQPLAYLVNQSFDTFLFTADGRYYLYDDGWLWVSDEEFGSHREFLERAVVDGGWGLPAVEVEMRKGENLGWLQ
ncbi:hypothetical protein C8J57DRAFT_1647602 [Mycena rebaudengoi]|nr:hypothetical protein C8J57DRAFT_1647602 [Mycena rebaudengoi]